MDFTLHCTAPGHASRQGEDGWADELGHVSSDDPEFDVNRFESGMMCGACGRDLHPNIQPLEIELDRQTIIDIRTRLAAGQTMTVAQRDKLILALALRAARQDGIG